MSVTTFSIILAVLAGLAILSGLWLVRAVAPFFVWFRSLAGLVLILVGVTLSFVAWEIHSYSPVSGLEPVASVSVTRTGTNEWQLTIFGPGDGEKSHVIPGDRARIGLDLLGPRFSNEHFQVPTLMRLGEVGGRYLQFEDALAAQEGVTPASSGIAGEWRQWLLSPVFFIPETGPAYMPLRDGAVYDLWVSGRLLVAGPANSVAEAAWESWE